MCSVILFHLSELFLKTIFNHHPSGKEISTFLHSSRSLWISDQSHDSSVQSDDDDGEIKLYSVFAARAIFSVLVEHEIGFMQSQYFNFFFPIRLFM